MLSCYPLDAIIIAIKSDQWYPLHSQVQHFLGLVHWLQFIVNVPHYIAFVEVDLQFYNASWLEFSTCVLYFVIGSAVYLPFHSSHHDEILSLPAIFVLLVFLIYYTNRNIVLLTVDNFYCESILGTQRLAPKQHAGAVSFGCVCYNVVFHDKFFKVLCCAE